MNALTKNKEEIEKMQEELSCLEGEFLRRDLELELKTTIKTSILWCSFCLGEDFIILFDEDREELRTHLNWLKEQEKKI